MKANPMKCKKDMAYNRSGYIYQKKIRGGRLVQDNGLFKTRHSDLSVNYKYPELVEEIDDFCPLWEKSIIDGEVAVLNKQGIPDQSLLQSRSGRSNEFEIAIAKGMLPVVWLVFDMVMLDGKNLSKERLDARAVDDDSYLKRYCKETEHIRFLKWYEDGEQLFKEYTRIGGEGVVAKKIDSPYVNGYRGDYWLKWKRVKEDVDCEVIGITQKDALVLMQDGEYRGKCYPINNHDADYPATVAKNFEMLKCDESVIDVPSSVRNEVKFWVKPKIIAVVDFHDHVNPVFNRFRVEDL